MVVQLSFHYFFQGNILKEVFFRFLVYVFFVFFFFLLTAGKEYCDTKYDQDKSSLSFFLVVLQLLRVKNNILTWYAEDIHKSSYYLKPFTNIYITGPML